MVAGSGGDVFVAGKSVGADWRLVAQIAKTHIVTVAQDPALVQNHPLLTHVRLLVLDCQDNEQLSMELVKQLNPRVSGLPILLVNGRLEQEQIAEVFASGILDYFAAPYDSQLLVERINVLCSRGNRERARRGETLRPAEWRWPPG